MTGALGRRAALAWALLAAPAGALVALLAYVVDPVAPLGLVAAAGLVALAWLRPLWSVGAGIALLPAEAVALPLGALGLTPAELVFVLTGLIWAARRVTEGRLPWTRSPLGRPVVLLLLSGLPGLAVALDPAATIRNLVLWSCFALVLSLVAEEAGPRELRGLLGVLAAAGAVVGAIAAAGSGGEAPQLSSLGDTATGRAVGAFGDPNILGTFLAMAFPAALLLAFDGRWRRRPLALGAIGAILAGLALSLSRGGILASAGVLALMMGWAPLRRLALFGVAGLVAVTVLAGNPLGNVTQVKTVVERVESLRFQSSSQTDQRSVIYERTPEIIADYWATGVGALNYPRFAIQYGVVEPSTGLSFDHAHNVLLTFGAEQGVLGLLAGLWLIAAIVRRAPGACGRGAGPDRGLGFAVVGALVAVGLQGLVDFTLRSNAIAALTFIMIGALAALVSRPAASAPARA